MSHAKNKVDWCLKKAEKELKEGDTHRGLIKVKPDKKEIYDHIAKAEHNLKAGIDFPKIGYSDWSASAFFYSMYQCFLAIAEKFGYRSGNQECTFALIRSLIEEKKIDFDIKLLEKVASIEVRQAKQEEKTSVKVREQYQYGTELSIPDDLFNELRELSQKVLSKTKEITEE